MPLNKEARIQKISETKKIEGKKIGNREVEWEGELVSMDIYKIPVEYLVYNKNNGRILSRIKSLETQNPKLDAESKEGNDSIQNLLFMSNESRNRKTEANIRTHGQKEVGIITRDGIVIDGNRRLMCLNRIIENPKKDVNPEKFKNFKAVILPVNLADAPDQIQKLETTFQMGEDKKLDYNPIEKYLRVQDLSNDKKSVKTISEWMGEPESEISNYLRTIDTMNEYLKVLGYEGVYTQLDNREDEFISLSKWTKNFRSENGSEKPFDGYKSDDVSDLELICFDYIRAKHKKHGGVGKRFRQIADGQQANHIFGNEELWKKFRDNHFDKIDVTEEDGIDYNSSALKSHLDDRDIKFKSKYNDFLNENLNDTISYLSNIRNKNKPGKLIEKAVSALMEVKIKAPSFSNSDTQKQLKEVVDISSKLLYSGDVVQILQLSFSLLSDAQKRIDNDKSDENKDKLDLVKKINGLSFEVKKTLGG